jgi:hypothetical protein
VHTLRQILEKIIRFQKCLLVILLAQSQSYSSSEMGFSQGTIYTILLTKNWHSAKKIAEGESEIGNNCLEDKFFAFHQPTAMVDGGGGFD